MNQQQGLVHNLADDLLTILARLYLSSSHNVFFATSSIAGIKYTFPYFGCFYFVLECVKMRASVTDKEWLGEEARRERNLVCPRSAAEEAWLKRNMFGSSEEKQKSTEEKENKPPWLNRNNRVEKEKAKAVRTARWGKLFSALAEAADPVDGEKLDSVDANRIDDRLYLGGLRAARNIRWLRHVGVTHILSAMQDWTSSDIDANCANPDEYKYVTKLKRKYVLVEDNFSTDIAKYFSSCFRWIDKALRGGGTVLIHCHMGISRSATIMCSYWMRKHSLSLSKTLEHIKGKRRCVCPNEGFMAQLRRFEAEREKVHKAKRRSAIIKQLCKHMPYPAARATFLFLDM